MPEVVKLLKQYEAEIVHEGMVKKINLSYPVKKELQAYFGYCYFRLQPERLQDIHSALRTNPVILRSLLMVRTIREVVSHIPREPKRETVQARPAAPQVKTTLPISNEELEKKIDEILS